MPSQYTIYLVNQSSSTQTFWCFLTRPAEIASDPNVFANSSASIAIDSNDPSTNYFVIPVQYSVGAGASNNAVGLDVQVTSTISQNSDLAQVWNADYANAPPKKGPKLNLASTSTGPNSIKLVTNSFNQEDNESLGWYSNQSFGIQTASGFMGMTWSRSPNQSRTLTPKLSFYISVGSFGSSTLADWTQVSNDSAQVSVPGSFTGGACTVTLLNNGKWKIAPGKPAQFALLENLAFLKSDEHSQFDGDGVSGRCHDPTGYRDAGSLGHVVCGKAFRRRRSGGLCREHVPHRDDHRGDSVDGRICLLRGERGAILDHQRQRRDHRELQL